MASLISSIISFRLKKREVLMKKKRRRNSRNNKDLKLRRKSSSKSFYPFRNVPSKKYFLNFWQRTTSSNSESNKLKCCLLKPP